VGATCFVATGSGEVRITITTAGGPVHMKGTFAGLFTGLGVLAVAGLGEGVAFSGTLAVAPIAGDCLHTPVTEIGFTGGGLVVGM
ncbi:MAG: hypothetical protein ACREJP_07380, partial [Candidatus Methylomirabilales bacterium]